MFKFRLTHTIGCARNLFNKRSMPILNNFKSISINQISTNRVLPMEVTIQNVTNNIKLYTEKPRNMKLDPKSLRLHEPIVKPLLVLFAWYSAQPKHVAKYAEIYIKQGFDVVALRFSVFEILRPKGRVQVVAEDMLKFLSNNAQTNPLFFHGFSGGAYVWGECMVKMESNMDFYRPMLNRIRGQVWDSISDGTDFPYGVAKTIFPNSTFFGAIGRGLLFVFLKVYYFLLNHHYDRSSKRFHDTFIHCPALFLFSKNDPIGTEKSNQIFVENYKANGIPCTWKCWDVSEHVGHLRMHQKEYLEAIHNHLVLVKIRLKKEN